MSNAELDIDEIVERGPVDTIRNSIMLKLAIAGALMFLFGFALQTGVWSAIFAIWGVALFAFGCTVYLLIWYSHQ